MLFKERSKILLGFGDLLRQSSCIYRCRGCGGNGDSRQSTGISERNVGGKVSGSVSDYCSEQICEAPIGNIWKLLQEELGGIAASGVVLNCLHVILSLAILSRNLIGAGEELVHITMNVGKSSEILSRKFWVVAREGWGE